MSERVIIIGAGGHGRVVADIVRASGDAVIGFLDDDRSADHVLGPVSMAAELTDCRFVIAVGANRVRKLLSWAELPWYTAIHPTAVISPSARVGEGTVVMANAVVNAGAEVGDHCIVNTGAIVEHDCRLDDFVHLSPGAALGGTVRVGEECHIGIGACVRNNITICPGCTVGAGAAVVKDITEPGVYGGVPARRLK